MRLGGRFVIALLPPMPLLFTKRKDASRVRIVVIEDLVNRAHSETTATHYDTNDKDDLL